MALKTEERGQPSLLERPRPLAVRTRAVGDHDTPPRNAGRTLSAPAGRRRDGAAPNVSSSISCPGTRRLEDRGRALAGAFGGRRRLFGAIALLLLAVATVTVTYLYY